MICLNSAILQWLRHVCIAATLMADKQHLIGFMFHVSCINDLYDRNMLVVPM